VPRSNAAIGAPARLPADDVLGALRRSLVPLAVLAKEKCLDPRSDDHPLFALNDRMITVGDVRRAQEALELLTDTEDI
jgi:hypothetical protein